MKKYMTAGGETTKLPETEREKEQSICNKGKPSGFRQGGGGGAAGT